MSRILTRLTALLASLLSLGPALAELHPPVPLLDATGARAVDTGAPLSALKSCDGCHDTAYIAAHGFHFDAGASEPRPSAAWPWDSGPGLFGRLDPLSYQRYTPPAAPAQDLDLAGWVRHTPRHAGGGPAAALVEPNCFLCHLATPDDAARRARLAAGDFAWATTATLGKIQGPTGPLLIPTHDGGLRLDPAQLDAEGRVDAQVLGLGDPRPANCGLCHGQTPAFSEAVTWAPDREARATELTGQIFAAQRIRASGLNLRHKDQLGRPWDVHAERMLGCIDCHPAANNPGAWREGDATRPGHLRPDARAPSLRAFLQRPDHNLQKGASALGTVADGLDGGMRRCEDCHDAAATHDWLPHKARHFEAMLCETCHIPTSHAPVRQTTDWTVLDSQGEPSVRYRGLTGAPGDAHALIEASAPVILPRTDAGGRTRLAPHQIHTTWLWTRAVAGAPGTPETRAPVTLAQLTAALLPGGRHPAALIAALDRDGDGALSAPELRLDTPARRDAVAARLRDIGVRDPQIIGEIQPIGLHHGVAPGRAASRDCARCHHPDAPIEAPIELAAYIPAGAEIHWSPTSRTAQHGALIPTADGPLLLQPQLDDAGYHLMGRHRLALSHLLGLLAVLGALAGALLHGGLRLRLALRRRREP